MGRNAAKFFLLLALLFWSVDAGAARLAILPLEDLSLGDNGVDLAFTTRLQEVLRERGLEVVPQREVLAFMATNRMRWLGRIETIHATRMGRELNADFILLGSVNQARERDPAALALTLQLVRAVDAQLVWSGGAELCRVDRRRLLAIAEPRELENLKELVLVEALAAWPAVLPAAPADYPVTSLAESITITPQVVRPGETVRCWIRFDDRSRPAGAVIGVLFDQKMIPARYLLREQLHEAAWEAPSRDGRYPVSVTVITPELGSRTVFAGSFLVDGTTPEPQLILGGQVLEGMAVMRGQLRITPLLKVPEPLRNWEIEILDTEGAVIKAERGQGGLPGRFSWWGQRQDGRNSPDGEYAVRLTVWDRAGNRGEVEEKFLVVRDKPEVSLRALRRADILELELEHQGRAPLVYWRVELRDEPGTLLYEADGVGTPQPLLAPLPAAVEKVAALVQALDALGNRISRRVENIMIQEGVALDQAEEEVVEPDGWAEDF
ncbi:hypothetical protein ACHHRT_04250 [Desulfurivibrio sp. D14AmB]|uniref:hypothetical protein n=1 Tax=Desulfurivibrio sp. D14AmB TaxID=3374370 RepID=UPI00376F07FD